MNKILLGCRNWVDTFRDRPRHLNIWMSADESALYLKYLNCAKSLLEFGCGGSTNFALATRLETIFSVESDLSWIHRLKQYKVMRKAIEAGRLTLFHGNIGKVGFCGVPCDLNYKDFTSYYSKPFALLGEEKCKAFDLVLIDGRFRVACVLSTLLNCGKDITIIIHDYSMRPEYHCIEKFLEKIDCVDSLAVFRLYPDINLEDVKLLLGEYNRNHD